MKNNRFVLVLSILFFVCCFTALAHAQSDDVDMVCLDGKKEIIKATSLDFEPKNIEIAVGDQVQLIATKFPANALLDTVIWSSYISRFTISYDGVLTGTEPDGTLGWGSTTNGITARTSLSHLFVSGTNHVMVYENYTYNGHVPEYVELAGIKWATSNVGADSPEEIGKYFMWGNTVGYTQEEFAGSTLYNEGGFKSSNYTANSQWGNGSSATSFTPGDRSIDAATINKGINYVSPTLDQLETLINSDDVVWVSLNGNHRRFERSSVQGVVVMKKGTKPTDGQFIFIPASGFYQDKGVIRSDYSYLWSSDKNSGINMQIRTNDNPGKIKEPTSINVNTNTFGYQGRTIRPIYRECNPFSVSATAMVEFSMGNAQSNGTTWRFAQYQYTIIGNTTSDWTDLHLYNANYSSLGSEWRVLSNAEWTYLLSGRTNAVALRSAATVGGVPGLIILPDNWEWPEDIAAEKQWETGSNNTSAYSFTTDWNDMEEAGAIFLPIAGWRNNNGELKDTNKGYYWTSDRTTDKKGNVTAAGYILMQTNQDAFNKFFTTMTNGALNVNYSIRLVKDL